MTSIAHPVLRGQPATRTVSRRAIPGTATGASWLLLALVTVLNMIGLVMVMSASSVVSVRESGEPFSYFQRQLMWTGVGLVALVATLSVSLDLWRRHVRVWLGVSIAMLVAVLIPGVGITVNGASRWLGAGPFQLQPSELTKFALLLFVADLLARRGDHIDDWRWGLLPVLVYLGVVSALIMLQPNLGTTLIIVVMVLAMLFAAGVPLLPLTLTAAMFSTVAAAFEGVLLGWPAIAVSQQSTNREHWDTGTAEYDFRAVAAFVAKLVPIVADPAFPRQMLLNVNAPGEVPENVGGARATRLGRRIYNDELQLQSDVDGRRQYLIYGGQPGHHVEDGTDSSAIDDGCISVTPLHFNLTDSAGMSRLDTIDLGALLGGEA